MIIARLEEFDAAEILQFPCTLWFGPDVDSDCTILSFQVDPIELEKEGMMAESALKRALRHFHDGNMELYIMSKVGVRAKYVSFEVGVRPVTS